MVNSFTPCNLRTWFGTLLTTSAVRLFSTPGCVWKFPKVFFLFRVRSTRIKNRDSWNVGKHIRVDYIILWVFRSTFVVLLYIKNVHILFGSFSYWLKKKKKLSFYLVRVCKIIFIAPVALFHFFFIYNGPKKRFSSPSWLKNQCIRIFFL